MRLEHPRRCSFVDSGHDVYIKVKIYVNRVIFLSSKTFIEGLSHMRDAPKIGYARVSSVGQKLDVQLELLEKVGCETVFHEKLSGANLHRPELVLLLRTIREGDMVVVTKLDRLARSMADFWDTYKQIKDRGASLNILNMSLDTNSAQGRLMMGILSSVAEFERELIRERQADGIAKAKSEGRHLGRPKLKEQTKKKVIAMIKKGETKTAISEATGLGVSTVYKIQKEAKENKGKRTSEPAIA